MPIYLPYMIVFGLTAIASFAAISRGSFFTELVKSIFALLSLISLISLSVASAILFSWMHIFGLILIYLITLFIVPVIFRALFRRPEPSVSSTVEPPKEVTQLSRIIAEYAFNIAELGENTATPDLSSILCTTAVLVRLLCHNDLIDDNTVSLLFKYTFDNVRAYLPPSFQQSRISDLLFQYYDEAKDSLSPLGIKVTRPIAMYGVAPAARFLSSKLGQDPNALEREFTEMLQSFFLKLMPNSSPSSSTRPQNPEDPVMQIVSEQKQKHPFSENVIGRIDPYSGTAVQTKSDYDRYLIALAKDTLRRQTTRQKSDDYEAYLESLTRCTPPDE